MNIKELLDVIKKFDEQVRPYPTTYINVHGKEKPTIEGTRAEKDVRYAFFKAYPKLTLNEKVFISVELIKVALSKVDKPVVSCSFGIDSIVTLWLVRKALEELGRDPSDIQVVWNDTKNEFQEVRSFQKEITEKWNLDLVITKPKKLLMKVLEENGNDGKVTVDYFDHKGGNRKDNKRALSEKCCHHLKHEPMKWAKKEHQWSLLFVGTRGDESNQRKIAGLRDGDFFYSKREWNAFVCKPIQWFLDEDIWELVYKYNIPHTTIYSKNLIQKYPSNPREAIIGYEMALEKLGVDTMALAEEQVSTVEDRRAAAILKKCGFKLFTPRVGCQMCPIPVRFGYLQWIREYYPKVYEAMIYKLGYGAALMELIPDDVREDLEMYAGFDLTSDNVTDVLKDILEYRPCTFDRFDNKKNSKKARDERKGSDGE
jgi:3'-phosphoadenosine 5'-phosphosulfate sulfotransferase (PAPS reductase)/FAD synthetase